jgi:hypothetical protein
MYERILVPVDGGTTATKRLRGAIKLARCHGSALRLICIVDEFRTVEASCGGGEVAVNEMRNIARSILDAGAHEAATVAFLSKSNSWSRWAAVPPIRCCGRPQPGAPS